MHLRRSSRQSTPDNHGDSPSRSMTLRSACRGECQSFGDAPDGSSLSTTHHHHHHHHHHEHNYSSHNQDKPLTKRIEPRASSESNVISAVRSRSAEPHQDSFARGNISAAKLLVQQVHNEQHMTLTSVTSVTKSSSTTTRNLSDIRSSSFVGRATIGGESANKSAYTFSSPIVPITPIASVSPIVATESSRNNYRGVHQSKYSDYSSGDDLEFDDSVKTDYTYARSLSYAETRQAAVTRPNMSRPRLRSKFQTDYDESVDDYASQYDKVDYSLHYQKTNQRGRSASPYPNYISPNVYHMATVESKMNKKNSVNIGDETKYQNNNSNKHKLDYGLDYESDDEFQSSFDISRRRRRRKSEVSNLGMIFNLVDCVIPITVLWWKLWEFVYWILTYTLFLDCWLLSRTNLNRKALFLWFTLLLLLLGALCSIEDGSEFVGTLSSGLKSGSAVVMSSGSDLISGGLHISSAIWAYLVAVFRTKETASVKVTDDYVRPQVNVQGVDKLEIEALVRAILGEELISIEDVLKRLKNHDANQGSLLASLQGQLANIVTKSQDQSKELKDIKQKFAADATIKKDDLSQLNRVESDLNLLRVAIRGFEEKQAVLEETQASILANIRNCCRNHTLDPAVIEKQVMSVFAGLVGKKPDGSDEIKPEMAAFATWLKSEFLSREDLEVKLATTIEDVMKHFNEDVGQRAEAVARLAAATAVRETLHQQQARVGGNVNFAAPSEEMVRRIVKEALALYDADKTAMPDYALESSGGTIISTRCSETYSKTLAQISVFGIPIWSFDSSPRNVIQPTVRPGECWAFKGSEGYLVLQLSGVVWLTGFSLEHIPASLAPNGNIDSAPKDFTIYGLRNEHDHDGILVGQYTYDINGDPLQYFKVEKPLEEPFPIIEILIRSNHGNLDFTCLYRLRVHGVLA